MLKIAKENYKKGTYCLRCGLLKDEIKKYKDKCCVYGKFYKRHIYK